jgi:hypothetical protein
MVHLASIPTNKKIGEPLVEGVEKLTMAPSTQEDLFTTSVYGSKFAAEDLPKHEMPEGEMPKEVAYRMIRDDLSLDGNPMLKYDMDVDRNATTADFVCVAWLHSLQHIWYVHLLSSSQTKANN